MSYTNVVFKQNIMKSVHKDDIQRERLDDRVGYNSKFQTAGNLIFKPSQNSTLHVNQKQRFNKDHDKYDKGVRENKRDKDDKFYNARLDKQIQRDQERWCRQENLQLKEQYNRLKHQTILLENKRNINGLGYNPITQQYERSKRGNLLRNQDDKKSINRFIRSKNILQKNNANFNIITGQDKADFQEIVPQKFKKRVEEKYELKKQRQAIKYQPLRDKYDYLDD